MRCKKIDMGILFTNLRGLIYTAYKYCCGDLVMHANAKTPHLKISSSFTSFDLSTVTLGQKLTESDFIFEGFKRGTVGLLSGEGGLGKTNLALLLACHAATGINISGYPLFNPRRTNKVVYVTCEDSPEEIHDAILDLVNHYSERIGFQFPADKLIDQFSLLDFRHCDSDFTHSDKDSLKVVLEEGFQGADLFILDTFSDLHSFDENSSRDMNLLMRELVRFAERMNAAVLIVHHTTKTASLTIQQMRLQSVVRGSSVIVNKSKFFIRLTPVEKNEIKLGKGEFLTDYVHATFGGNKTRTTELIYSRQAGGVLEPFNFQNIGLSSGHSSKGGKTDYAPKKIKIEKVEQDMPVFLKKIGAKSID
jgi:KaiC/GvpD/RAD55 family RecA-like ATPase